MPLQPACTREDLHACTEDRHHYETRDYGGPIRAGSRDRMDHQFRPPSLTETIVDAVKVTIGYADGRRETVTLHTTPASQVRGTSHLSYERSEPDVIKFGGIADPSWAYLSHGTVLLRLEFRGGQATYETEGVDRG